MGHSAGGHLVSLLGCHQALHQQFDIETNYIKGVVCLSGVYNCNFQDGSLGESFVEAVFGKDKKKWPSAFPTFYVDRMRSLPKFLILNGEYEYGLKSQGVAFFEILKKKGCDVEYHAYTGINHFSITCFWKDVHYYVFAHVLAFLCGVSSHCL